VFPPAVCRDADISEKSKLLELRQFPRQTADEIFVSKELFPIKRKWFVPFARHWLLANELVNPEEDMIVGLEATAEVSV